MIPLDPKITDEEEEESELLPIAHKKRKKRKIYTKNKSETFYTPENIETLRIHQEENPQLYEHTLGLIEKFNLNDGQSFALRKFINDLFTFEVVNIVAPINILRAIDKDRIQTACIKHDLPYKRFPKFSGLPVTFHMNCGSTFTGIFFKTGKINIVGLKKGGLKGLDEVIAVLKRYEKDFFGETGVLDQSLRRIANRVYSLKISSFIDLSNLSLFCNLYDWRNIKYHGETFPGAVLKFEDILVKILFFKTGSMIAAGVSSTQVKIQLSKKIPLVLCDFIVAKRKLQEKV